MYVYHGWDFPYWAFLKIGVFEKLKKVDDLKKPAFWTGVKFFPNLKKTHRQTDSHIYHMMQILRLGHCIAEYWNSGRTNLHIYYMMLEYK